MTSESMLVYYLKFYRDLWWPGGDPAPATPPRTEEQKQETKKQAKAALYRNTPGNKSHLNAML